MGNRIETKNVSLVTVPDCVQTLEVCVRESAFAYMCIRVQFQHNE